MSQQVQEPTAPGSARRRRRPHEPLLVVGTVVVALVATAVIVVTHLPGGGNRSGRTSAGGDAPSSRPSVAGATAGQLSVPATGAYFGIYNNPRDGDRRSSLTQLEQQVGRRFDIDHRYYKWNQPFPRDYESWTVAQGRTPLINWVSQTRDRQQIPWADIASGAQDDVIKARADALRAFGKPVLLVFQHEPGQLVGTGGGRKGGTAEDYVAAWRHIVQTLRAEGTTNVSFVWVLTAYNFRVAGTHSQHNAPDALYPGDDVIDWIGVDGYNYYNCAAFGRTPWRSFDQLFGDWYKWATEHHKPLMLAEWGAQEDPARPERKGKWLRDVAGAVRDKPAIKAVVYFNSAPACPNWVDSTPQALSGFRALTGDSYFHVK